MTDVFDKQRLDPFTLLSTLDFFLQEMLVMTINEIERKAKNNQQQDRNEYDCIPLRKVHSLLDAELPAVADVNTLLRALPSKTVATQVEPL